MPTADLRALAERLGMLKPCAFCTEGVMEFACDSGVFEKGECPVCNATGLRLSTEAEVRAALFEAGWTWLDIYIRPDSDGDVGLVQGARRSDGPDTEARAEGPEAARNDLVLLALLRALEAARGY